MKADWLDLSVARILSLTSDSQAQGEPPRGGAGSSFGDSNQERRQHQEIKAKDQHQNKPDHYDTPDTEEGGGSADDDTSAGYGLGGSTGNSSDPSTGLSPIDKD